MKKQLLLLMMLLSAAASAFAVEVEIDGLWYDVNTETNKANVIQYKNDVKYNGGIVIPETVVYEGVTCSVTSIGSSAFYGCSGLTSITIGNSVTSIEREAFYRCSGLTSVTIGNSVTSIGYNAFFGCSALTSVHISDLSAWCKIIFYEGFDNPLFYAHHLYLNYQEVTNLVIPEDVTSLNDYAFKGCSSLTSVTIPNSVKSIGKEVFFRCSSLTSVTIGNSVTSIGDYAFGYCLGLTSVTIPNSVMSIGEKAFYECSSLTSVTIGNSVTLIGNIAFYGCWIENVLTTNSKTEFSKAFSDRTYQHAMLYIPEGTWREVVYNSSWYVFNNIREFTLHSGGVSSSIVYTLMDTKTFGYAVYDGVSNEVKIVKAFYSIDEQDANNCWMLLTQEGNKYLYNVGARKYATFSSDGRTMLTANVTPIKVEENDNGFMLGADTSRQWAFVKNNNLGDISGIAPLTSNAGPSAECYYSIGGQRTSQLQKGLNIVRMSDGTTKKMVIK